MLANKREHSTLHQLAAADSNVKLGQCFTLRYKPLVSDTLQHVQQNCSLDSRCDELIL